MKLLGYAVFKNDKMVKNKIFPTYEQAEYEAKSIYKWKELLKCRFVLPMTNQPFEADIRAILSEEVKSLDSNDTKYDLRLPKPDVIPEEVWEIIKKYAYEEYPNEIAEEIAYNLKIEKDRFYNEK